MDNNHDYWSPPLTADSTTPFNQGDPLLLTPSDPEGFDIDYIPWPSPPSFKKDIKPLDEPQLSRRLLHTNFQYKPRRPKFPLVRIRGFERPSFKRIAVLITLCVIAYPLLYILTFVARNKSLFVVRLIVAMWCSGIGFSLGYMLFTIGIQHLEAATWATVIHMSRQGGGMKFRDLAWASRHPTSLFPAVWIFASRLWNQEAMRRSRSSYDKRPWSLFLGFIILLAIFGPTLTFLFGRVMDIETFIYNQHVIYNEVLIAGDLSKDDVNRARTQLAPFQTFAQTWTLLPYGSSTPDTAMFAYNNDTVYFDQPSLSRFVPGGRGVGTFYTNQSMSRNMQNLASLDANQGGTGAMLRYSQWGIRIHCQKLPNPQVNLIPSSNHSFTYAFIPQDLLRGLFSLYGMALPDELKTAPPPGADVTIPSNINLSTISYYVPWPDNGIAHSFHSRPIDNTDPIHNQEWTTIETVVIRLNNSFTPLGSFPVYSNESLPDVNGSETKIGYDAAVCVQKYEPWVIETYNTSIGSPTTLRLVEKATYGTASLLPSYGIWGPSIANTRYLNATGKNGAYYVAHDNSINQMLKDNGRDQLYTPSPTTVSFTEGTGASGYLELSAERFALIRAQIDAAHVLPYLVGSAPIVARSYPDQTLAYATYNPWQLILLLAVILIVGLTAELFVPMLPLNTPRRGFGLYTWLAVLQSQELRFEMPVDDLNKFASLDELEQKVSDQQVKFCVGVSSIR